MGWGRGEGGGIGRGRDRKEEGLGGGMIGRRGKAEGVDRWGRERKERRDMKEEKSGADG